MRPHVTALVACAILAIVSAEPKYAKRLAEMNRLLEEEIRKAAPNTDNSQVFSGEGRWLTELKPHISQADYSQLRDVAYYVRTLPLDLVAKIQPGSAANPENVKRVERILNAAQWKQFFPFTSEDTSEGEPEGLGVYTYLNFLKAVGAFPAFCGDYSLHPRHKDVNPDQICRRLLASTFAHFNKETSAHVREWKTPIDRQGLYYVREMHCTNGKCGVYTIGMELYPASITQGNTYFGRGAFQLSHPVNYGTLSLLLFGNEEVLVKTPDLVADTWLALGSAVSYIITPAMSRPAIIEAIDGNYRPNAVDLERHLMPGFGLTTFIVNGPNECMAESLPKDHTGRSFTQVRADYYKFYVAQLGVKGQTDEASLTCEKMKSNFDEKSSSSRPYYFFEDDCRPVKRFAKFTAFEGILGLNKCRKHAG